MRHPVPLCFALALALPNLIQSQDLSVGDTAPALSIEKWVKGEPVQAFEEGKVYIVEFWATWCGPCIQGMPHLSEIQKHHRDAGLTVIGVSGKDRNGNSLEKVEAMVAEKGDGMGYTVAWDSDRETNRAYMEAAGRGGIPCCFVVDKAGKIAYVGHPMWLDEPIQAILDGTWDAEAGMAKIATAEKRMGDVFRGSKDPAATLTKLTALLKDYPTLESMLGDARYNLLVQAGRPEEAAAAGKKIVEAAIAKKDPMKLNAIAWGIVDPAVDLEERDLDLAMRAAVNAVELSKEKDANILDTLARVHACEGDYEQAIAWQTKAVAIDERLQEALDEYREKAAAKKDKKQ